MDELEATTVRQSDFDEYRRLLARDPNSLRFAEYAERLRQVGMLKEAKAICEEGLARRPAYATGYVVMGSILHDSGQTEKAEMAWAQALRLDPGHPQAHFRLGELFLDRGEHEKGMAALEAALLYNPDFPEVRAKLVEARGPDCGLRSTTTSSEETRRKPGERPAWLTADQYDSFIRSVLELPNVEAVELIDDDGTHLAGALFDTSTSSARKAAVQLVADARAMLFRLGAGRLRSIFVRTPTTAARCVPLGDLILLVAVINQSSAGETDRCIEQLLDREMAVETGDGGHLDE